MPASTLYDNIVGTIQRLMPWMLRSQLETLSLVIAAAAQKEHCQFGTLARAMACAGTQASKEQRLRRLCDNERITQQTHYQPIVRRALLGLKGQRVQVLIDRVLLGDHHNLLVVSVGFRRRSIPLLYRALAHRGASGEEQHKELLQEALTLLPAGVKVSIHGDSEFRSLGLFHWIRAQGHDALLGVRGDTLVYDCSGPRPAGTALQQRLGERQDVLRLRAVYLTEQRQGPVNVLAWWDKDDRGEPLVRGIMTNLPADGHTYQLGRRRMWIETLFRDWQSGGFHLDKTGLKDRQRFARLLIPLLIAYLWFVSVGRWVVKRGYRPLIDTGKPNHWQFSLFKLGIGWKDRLLSQGASLPALLELYV